jgi:hypothetical protein
MLQTSPRNGIEALSKAEGAGMNTNLSFMTLIQRLGKPETIKNADAELTRHVNMGYRIVSEIVLAGDDVYTRVIRLEREQAEEKVVFEDSPIGKMVREHGAERASQILQQETIDRMRGAYEARIAFYKNKSIPLPAFPVLNED